MRAAGVALALALCPPASVAVRMARVAPSDYALAMKARGGHSQLENPCRTMQTPKMCKEKPGMGRHTAAAVVSAYREDVHWLNEMPWSDNMTVFIHNRSVTRSHESKGRLQQDSVDLAEEGEETVKELNDQRTHPVEFVHLPNKGDEAGAYLWWIVRHYNDLPDVTFFIMGHRCAHHATFDMATALPSIRQCFKPSDGYMDLNTYRDGPDTKCEITSKILSQPLMGLHLEHFKTIWEDVFSKEMGAMPKRICWDNYGQFAVSRDAIRRHPKDFYKSLYKASMTGATTMEFFWRSIFVPDAASWAELKKYDRDGKLIPDKPYEFTAEELAESNRYVNYAEQHKTWWG